MQLFPLHPGYVAVYPMPTAELQLRLGTRKWLPSPTKEDHSSEAPTCGEQFGASGNRPERLRFDGGSTYYVLPCLDGSKHVWNILKKTLGQYPSLIGTGVSTLQCRRVHKIIVGCWVGHDSTPNSARSLTKKTGGSFSHWRLMIWLSASKNRQTGAKPRAWCLAGGTWSMVAMLSDFFCQKYFEVNWWSLCRLCIFVYCKNHVVLGEISTG